MEAASPIVLARMIEFQQQELNASEVRLDQLESIVEAQARVIRTMRDDLAESQERVHRLMQGSETVLRGLDVVYNHAKDMFIARRMSNEDWEAIFRGMLRADVGFAILNGAQLVDLTEDTEIEDNGSDTETDPGMEEEV